MFIGEIAALGTAICWALSSTSFAAGAKSIGVEATNHYRVLFAAVLLGVMHFFLFNTFIPDITKDQFYLILASSLVGIIIGDTFLFQALVDIGPRIAMLIFNIYPLITALLAWLLLSEKLSFLSWIGLFTVLLGTLWVVLEKNKNEYLRKGGKRLYTKGVIFALASALCQAGGMVIIKPVFQTNTDIDPLTVTYLRLAFSAILFWGIGLLRLQTRSVIKQISNKAAIYQIFVGSFMGPFVGMWLLHISLELIPTAIVAVLAATVPIMILPIVVFGYKEKITVRAVLGAVISVVGIAVLVLGE